MAVSFDLFGTLVRVDAPADPSATVARQLRERDVPVPDDFAAVYRKPHVDVSDGAEVPLSAHVDAALASCGIEASETVIRRAVLAAFDPEVERRPSATAAIEAARGVGPVGVLSNCSVTGLVERTLISADLEDAFDAVVASVDCGWRKPDPRAFGAIADRLGVGVDELLHVGDDPATDGGAPDAGAEALLLSDVPLDSVPETLRRRPEVRR